jgi:hypothetical protein
MLADDIPGELEGPLSPAAIDVRGVLEPRIMRAHAPAPHRRVRVQTSPDGQLQRREPPTRSFRLGRTHRCSNPGPRCNHRRGRRSCKRHLRTRRCSNPRSSCSLPRTAGCRSRRSNRCRDRCNRRCLRPRRRRNLPAHSRRWPGRRPCPPRRPDPHNKHRSRPARTSCRTSRSRRRRPWRASSGDIGRRCRRRRLSRAPRARRHPRQDKRRCRHRPGTSPGTET